MRPHFLIIGAPRCGTDFLLYNLSAHPQICCASEREIHFFDDHFEKGLDWYERFFDDCKPDQIAGEKTAHYFVAAQCPKRIKESLGHVKHILSLRDPVDRAYSHYRNWLGWGDVDIDTSFRECCEKKPIILEMGKYFKHLQNYLQVFDSSDFCIVFFEDLLTSPHEQYRKILNAINVDDTFKLPMIKKYNAPQKIYQCGKKRISTQKYEVLKAVVPERILSGVLKIREYEIPSLSPRDSEFLQNYYKNYNEKLFNLLGIETKWRKNLST